MSAFHLPRLHGFEFCDQAWLPQWMREGLLDCLTFVHRLYQPYWNLYPFIAQWARNQKILDFASGSGEQISQLLRISKSNNVTPPSFILSDLYPDIDSYERLQEQYKDVVSFVVSPLSIVNAAERSETHWSTFSSFHHFPPEVARLFLLSAAGKADGICIAEVTQRTLSAAGLMFLGLPIHLIAPLFSRRFGFRKFLFTTIIPIIPLIVAFDGIVSVLRTYTRDEILEMFPEELKENFSVEFHAAYWRFCPMKASVILFRRKGVRHQEVDSEPKRQDPRGHDEVGLRE